MWRREFEEYLEARLVSREKEVLVSYEATKATVERVRDKFYGETLPVIEGKALSVFRKYSDFVLPHLPKVHGAVLLWGNGFKETEESEMSEIRSEAGVLRGKTTLFHYPARLYFLPDSLETVWYQGHKVEELPREGEPFEGFERYRNYHPDNFFKVTRVGADARLSRPSYVEDPAWFSLVTVMKVAEMLADKLPEGAGVDRIELTRKMGELRAGLVKVKEDAVEDIVKVVEPVKRRIGQLVDVLLREKKMVRGVAIRFKGSVRTDKRGRELAYYFVPDTLSIVVARRTGKEVVKEKKLKKMAGDPRENDYMFIDGGQYIAMDLVKLAIGRYPD